MSNKVKEEAVEVKEEAVEVKEEAVEVKEEAATKEQQKNFSGTVVNCSTLNVRSAPSIGDNILSVLQAGSIITIDKEASDQAWFKIKTEDSLEGYCDRKYIALRY